MFDKVIQCTSQRSQSKSDNRGLSGSTLADPTLIPSTKSHCRKGKRFYYLGRTQNDWRQEMKSSKLTGNQNILYRASEVHLFVANEGVSMQVQNVFH